MAGMSRGPSMNCKTSHDNMHTIKKHEARAFEFYNHTSQCFNQGALFKSVARTE